MAVNKKEYAFEDVEIVLFGRPIVGFQSVEYESMKEHSNVKGRGNRPVAMGRGSEDFTGKLTLLQSEVEAIQASIPNNKPLTSLPAFNMIVSYAPTDGSPIVVDAVLGCRVKSYKKGISTDDGNMTVDLDLLPFDIKYNI